MVLEHGSTTVNWDIKRIYSIRIDDNEGQKQGLSLTTVCFVRIGITLVLAKERVW